MNHTKVNGADLSRPSNSKKSSSAAKARSGKARHSWRSWVLAALLIAAAVCLAAGLFGPKEDAFAQGRNYLQAQAQIDIRQLDAQLAKQERERLMNAVEQGDTSIFSLFRNSVILGDSRAYGFETYGFVPANQVMAAAGYTVDNVDEFVSTVQSMQPEYIYLSYGVNDMGKNIGGSLGEDGYGKEFEAKADLLLSVSPESIIVINSIIPCRDDVTDEVARWDRADDFNRQLSELCSRRGWIFVDNGYLAQNGTADIYQPDGVHFLADFYAVWAENMLETAIEA